jgi:RNA polymerase sigma-70 factor, ECF subfamily
LTTYTRDIPRFAGARSDGERAFREEPPSAVPSLEGQPDDAEWPAAPALGELLNFEDVYVQHFDFVCRSLRLLGVTPDGVEDAAQDAFGIVSRRLVEFAGNAALKTWLFAIVQRVAANHRRSTRRKQAPLVPLGEGLVGEAPSPEAHAEAAQSAALITAFCGGLEESRRAVLVLALVEGIAPRELAVSLGVPLHTVYSRIRTLRQDLKTYLEQHEQDRG